MKILIMGLPGAGKTTLAEALARELSCAHFNADEIRKEINKDLGFSIEDRLEQARRMGVLCDIASRYGANVIADFICPTPEARELFDADFTIWVDRIKEGRFEDTNKLFVPPEKYDARINGPWGMQYYAEELARRIEPRHKTSLYSVG
jgi:RNase adaptor protein for sRNA GlmZ degradation